MRSRHIATALAALGVAVIAVVLTPAFSAAQITGGCSVTVNGRDAGTAHNASSAIKVGENETVTVVGTAPGPITGYTVSMKFGPIKYTAKTGTVSGGDTTWTGQVKMSDYAKYGVGLYRVEGASTGTVCTGWVYLKITGRNPLTTVAGATAAVMTVGGAVGLASAARRPKAPKVKAPKARAATTGGA
jgi:hypothetical protein